ncbi:MAG: hypothetical protein V7646_7062 [Pseudonocardia sp.]|jgi:hypothetical protein
MADFFAGRAFAAPDDLTRSTVRICRQMTEAIETGRLRPGALPSLLINRMRRPPRGATASTGPARRRRACRLRDTRIRSR